MLRTLLVFAFMLCLSSTQAQYFQNITVTPQYPGPMDSVRVVIQLQFTSGNCDMSNAISSVNNDSIRVEVAHCPGPLGIICDVTDIINLGVLPIGTYSTNVVLRRGNYFSADPCAGSSLADSSTINFTVYSTSGIEENTGIKNLVFFERESNSVVLDGEIKGEYSFMLFNTQGAVVFKNESVNSSRIRLPQLSAGVYMYNLRKEDGNTQSGKISVQ